MNTSGSRPNVIGVGEVLWDVFPDGPRFGGAPANFACSVAGLGREDVDAWIESSVGRDELGHRAVEILRNYGVDTSCVEQIDRPTGQVFVKLNAAGEASYEFAADTAWDNLAWSEDLQRLAARADVVCFGTLAQRSETSRATIQRFVRETPKSCLRILDVNLRPPFWSREVVLQSLELANVVKLNDSELAVLGELLGWHGTDADLLRQLIDAFSLQMVALTRGAEGALLLNASGEQSDMPSPPTAVVDTVGAGDAYTAALAIGMLKHLPIATMNAWGVRVAAFVCSRAGATPRLPDELRYSATAGWLK